MANEKYLITYQLKLEKGKKYEEDIAEYMEEQKQKGIPYKTTLCKGIESLIKEKKTQKDEKYNELKNEIKEIKTLLISILGGNINISQIKLNEKNNMLTIGYSDSEITEDEANNLLG